MAGSVNKVILVGNLGTNPKSGVPNRATGGQSLDCHLGKLAGHGDRRAQGAHRVAPGRDLQRKPDQDRRAVSEEGRQGLLEGQMQTRKWTDQQGVEKYSTEVVLQSFNAA